MTDGFPKLSCRYSRLSRLTFGIAFLILGNGGIGMVLGLIEVESSLRLQQVAIGVGFLSLAAAFGYAIFRMIRAAGSPVVTLDGAGFWDRRLTAAPVPWSAIARIEGVEPSFLERLVLPAGRTGRLLVHIEPSLVNRVVLLGTLEARLQGWLLLRRGRLRIFHKTLDAPYAILLAALDQGLQTARSLGATV